MKVLLIVRDKRKGGKSIEGVFQPFSRSDHPGIQLQKWEYNNSKALWVNLQSMIQTKAAVFHITGDLNYLAFLLPSRKIICTVHDIGRYKELSGIKKLIYSLWWIKWPVVKASKIVAVSNYTRSDIIRLMPSYASKVMVIANGIHPDFKSMFKPCNTTRPRILQVGTAVHKNLQTVFKSLHGLECILSIVGQITGDHIRQLEELGITYENYVDLDIHALREQYEQCDLVVFVSLHEGFGLPIIEAQTVGRPVITSKLASIPEVAGDGAFFVNDPMDADELRAAIIQLLHDATLRNTLIEKGLKNAQRYTYDNMVKAYLNLYQEVAAG